MRLHRVSFLPVVLGLSAGLLLVSCAEDTAEPTAGDGATTTTSATSEPTAAPSSSPTVASSAPSSSEPATTVGTTTSEPSAPPAPAALDLPALLLPADRVGKLNQEWRWFAGNDFDAEPDRLVACHRFGLADTGAEEVAVREYTSDLDAEVRAHHLVAGYPDEVTARRAYAVLESWHSSCERRLERRAKGRDGVYVSPTDPVSTAAGRALTYVTIQPTATGSSSIENVGIARDGRVVTVVVVRLEGDDFNYPRGRTPAAITVRNAAQRSG